MRGEGGGARKSRKRWRQACAPHVLLGTHLSLATMNYKNMQKQKKLCDFVIFPAFSQTCPEMFVEMSWTCPRIFLGNVMDISQKFPGHFHNNSRPCAEFPGRSWTFLGHSLAISWTFLGILWKFHGHILPDISKNVLLLSVFLRFSEVFLGVHPYYPSFHPGRPSAQRFLSSLCWFSKCSLQFTRREHTETSRC